MLCSPDVIPDSSSTSQDVSVLSIFLSLAIGFLLPGMLPTSFGRRKVSFGVSRMALLVGRRSVFGLFFFLVNQVTLLVIANPGDISVTMLHHGIGSQQATHAGNTGHLPQLAFPTNANYPVDTVAYRRGYFYPARNDVTT